MPEGHSALAKQVPLLATAASPGEVSNRNTAVKDLDTVDRRENVEVNVFVRSTEPLKLGPHDRAQGRLAAMRLPLEDLENLAGDPNIVIVEPAETLKSPRPLKGIRLPVAQRHAWSATSARSTTTAHAFSSA